jgi:tetratricopeptide (TPR) repeat protein
MKYYESARRLISLVLLLSGCSPAALAQSLPDGSALNRGNDGRELAMLSTSSEITHLRDAAQSNYQALQFQSAANIYRRICQMPSADANDYYWLGESYFHLKQANNAAVVFSQALTLNPQADNIRVRLVEALLLAKQTEQAKQSCASAINTVKDPFTRKQLSTLLRVCSLSGSPIKPPKAPVESHCGQMEQ